MYVCNKEEYGFLLVLLCVYSIFQDEVESFMYVQLEVMVKYLLVEFFCFILVFIKILDKMGFDEVFMINLRWWQDWWECMLWVLQVQEIECWLVEVVDGKVMNISQVEVLGIQMLFGYWDFYYGWFFIKGELGCFLSYYNIWKEVVDWGLQKLFVFEDDLCFEIFFKRCLMNFMWDVEWEGLDWDFIYVGWKWMQVEYFEKVVFCVRNLVEVDYFYWILVYVIFL